MLFSLWGTSQSYRLKNTGKHFSTMSERLLKITKSHTYTYTKHKNAKKKQTWNYMDHKITLIYSLTAETRRQSIALPWIHHSACLWMTEKAPWVLIFWLLINFSAEVNLQIWNLQIGLTVLVKLKYTTDHCVRKQASYLETQAVLSTIHLSKLVLLHRSK